VPHTLHMDGQNNHINKLTIVLLENTEEITFCSDINE